MDMSLDFEEVKREMEENMKKMERVTSTLVPYTFSEDDSMGEEEEVEMAKAGESEVEIKQEWSEIKGDDEFKHPLDQEDQLPVAKPESDFEEIGLKIKAKIPLDVEKDVAGQEEGLAEADLVEDQDGKAPAEISVNQPDPSQQQGVLDHLDDAGTASDSSVATRNLDNSIATQAATFYHISHEEGDKRPPSVEQENSTSIGPVKETSPTPPLKANGLRIKVGGRRNSGPTLPPVTESDALVNFDPKPLPELIHSLSNDRCEVGLPMRKELSSGTEEDVPATQVHFVIQGSNEPTLDGISSLEEPMALSSTTASFQPPLPTSESAPPPPLPPLPPPSPPKNIRESCQVPGNSSQTAPSHSQQEATPSFPAPTSSNRPTPQTLKPTHSAQLPQGSKVSKRTTHTGERSKSFKDARPSEEKSPTKEKSPQNPVAPVLQSPQLPSRYRIPKTSKAGCSAGSGGNTEARSASAARVDAAGSLVKQGREGRRKPEKAQR